MLFRAVFFDVDGTLIGLRPDPEVFYQQVCEETGLECRPDALARAREVALSFFHGHGLSYLGDEPGMWREANRQVFLFLGAGERAGEYADRFQQLFRANTSDYAYPDVFPTLDALQSRGYILGALTGRLHSSEGILQKLGIRRYLSFYLHAGELGVLKPDPRLYQEALARAGVTADQAVLVGDHPSDVEGARSVGITPLVIARRRRLPLDGLVQFDDLRQLIEWLEPANGGKGQG